MPAREPTEAGIIAGAVKREAPDAPALYAEESQYQPMYNQMQQQMEQQNLSAYAGQYMQMMPQAQGAANISQASAVNQQLLNYIGTSPMASAYLMASSPQFGQLANMATQQMGAGLDPTVPLLR